MFEFIQVKPSTLFAIQAAVVVGLPYLIWRLSGLSRWAPLGIVQIVTAVLLSASVLGAAAPDLWAGLFPAKSHGVLDGLGWLAVMLFTCLTGARLAAAGRPRKGAKLVSVGVASTVVPLACGALFGAWLGATHPSFMGPGIPLLWFALGVGACLAVTALPILAIIVQDMGIQDHEIGKTALTSALFDDVLLWIVMAVVASAVAGKAVGTLAVGMILLVFVHLLFMLFAARPLLARLWRSIEDAPGAEAAAITLFLVVCALSAAATNAIGSHFVIGAFVAGVVMPAGVRERVAPVLTPVTLYILLPFFFIATAFKANADFSEPTLILVFVLATAVAVVSKTGSAALAARRHGETWPAALTLGVLLQTKGLMEVVALRMMLDAGVISGQTFGAFLAMAVVSTVATKPLATWLLSLDRAAPAGASAVRS